MYVNKHSQTSKNKIKHEQTNSDQNANTLDIEKNNDRHPYSICMYACMIRNYIYIYIYHVNIYIYIRKYEECYSDVC